MLAQKDTKATAKQIQLIHIAKSKLDIDDETYRETLEARFNVTSSKELTYRQAAFFIEQFQKAGFKIAPKGKRPSVKRGAKVVAIATLGQRALIDVLKSNIVWNYTNGYEMWLENRMKLKKVLTTAEAFKVIEGLKGMLGITTKIISARELPFPYRPETHKFIDPKTGKQGEYVWMFDVSAKRLIRFSINGGEEACLTSKTP